VTLQSVERYEQPIAFKFKSALLCIPSYGCTRRLKDVIPIWSQPSSSIHGPSLTLPSASSAAHAHPPGTHALRWRWNDEASMRWSLGGRFWWMWRTIARSLVPLTLASPRRLRHHRVVSLLLVYLEENCPSLGMDLAAGRPPKLDFAGV
jgi:hypothetical protein